MPLNVTHAKFLVPVRMTVSSETSVALLIMRNAFLTLPRIHVIGVHASFRDIVRLKMPHDADNRDMLRLRGRNLPRGASCDFAAKPETSHAGYHAVESLV